MLPPGPELAVGARTRRIATVYTGSRARARAVAPERRLLAARSAHSACSAHSAHSALCAGRDHRRTCRRPPSLKRRRASLRRSCWPRRRRCRPPCSAAPRALARISYEDDAGAHDYAVIKASVSIGRGGVAYPVDVRIASSTDVSREHARIRHDAETGRFFLIDLSSLGTTVNGAPRAARLRRGRRQQARERRRSGAARARAHRSGRHGVPRLPRRALTMTLLLLRPLRAAGGARRGGRRHRLGRSRRRRD